MMQIVIDIDDKVYGLLRYFEESLGLNDKKDNSDDVKTALIRAVINGTPLPKGHGDLIDRKELLKQSYRIDDSATLSTRDVVNEEEIDSAQTIIEADKAEIEPQESEG